MTEWISVEEELPDGKHVDVLAFVAKHGSFAHPDRKLECAR